MIVGAVLLLGLTVAWLYFLWSRRRYYIAAYKIRGPWGFPFLGIAHKIFNLSEILYEIPKYAKANNVKTYYSWIGTIPTLFTMDPKTIEAVVYSPVCYNKAPFYNPIIKGIGDSLLTIKTPMWNRHRKLLKPSFGYRLVLTMFTKFNNTARVICDNFDKCVNQGEVQIENYLVEATLMSVIETTLGLDFTHKVDKKIIGNFETLLKLGSYCMMRPWLQWNLLWNLTKLSKQFSEVKASVNDFVKNLIETKVKVLEQRNNNAKETIRESIDIEKTSHVFIDQSIKIHQRNEFTVEDIVSHSHLMVIAGYDTTATVLYSVLVMLAIHPDIQERLFTEISSLYPSTEVEVTQEKLKAMTYLDMCINETLRLHPPIGIIGREPTEDIVISKDISIPSGTQIIIDVFNLHRNEDIWGPEALKFNPDNFLPANMANKHNCSFMPFSKGPRNCLGWQQAWTLLKVILPHLIRRYKFSTTVRMEDLKFCHKISLKYVDSPALEIQLR